MIGHPGERRLLAFQDGRLPDAARRRLAGHLADCQQCRDVVQGHRAVRAVLRLDIPSAPDGVLERILASRAQGALVVLPVVDPAPGRRPVRGVVGLAMALAAVLVIALVPVIPMTPLAGAWKWWIGFIVDWHPFSNGANGPTPELLKAPMAEPMVFDPSRMKPFEARYEVDQTNPSNFKDPVTGKVTRRKIRRVDSSLVYRVLDDRPASGNWLIQSGSDDSDPLDGRVTLDANTLRPHTWSRVLNRANYRQVFQYSLMGDLVLADVSYTGIVPPSALRWQPAGAFVDSLSAPTGTPIVISEADLIARFPSVRFSRNWSGAVYIASMSGYERNLNWRVRTYYVDGSAKFDTPAGVFEAWRVRSIDSRGFYYRTYYVRKSDGLWLGWEAEDRPSDYKLRVALLSTTLDAPTVTAH